jgi:hypothetical protein
MQPRVAAKLIKELSSIEVELPGSIPRLSLTIRAITCSGMKIKQRLQLLRSISGPVINVLQAVHAKKIGITLPLDKADVKLLGSVDGLLRDLIRGYNSVINDSRDSIGLFGACTRTQFAQACYGSVSFQTRRLMLHYEAYRPIRKGIWSQIHLVYKIAKEKELENLSLDIDRDGEVIKSSVEHIYKRAILIGRSDPYHFSFRGVTRLFESLDQWPAMVKLIPGVDKIKDKCMFIVDLESDYAAAPFFEDAGPTKGDQFLILDTSELMDRLNGEYKAVANDINGLKGIAQLQGFERMEILRHIVVSWGMHPIRKANREESGESCQIVFGLANIFNILHPDFDSDDADVIDMDSTAELQMVVGVFQEKFGKLRDKNALMSTWKIGNESKGGFSLYHTEDTSQELRVGDLLALRKSEDDDWTICIVRWAMVGEGSVLQAGVFKIGNNAEPISIKPLETGSDFRQLDYTAALHIPEATSFSNTDLVVAQKTIYSPSRSLYLRRKDRDHVIIATNQIVSSRSVDVFTYRYDVKDHQRPLSHTDTLRFRGMDDQVL